MKFGTADAPASRAGGLLTRCGSPHRWLLPVAAAALLASCGGGKSDTSAAEQAAAVDGQARRQALALPTSLAVPIAATTDPLMQGLTIPADAPTKGMWSAVQAWPMNAVHLALLPDGRVTSYGSLPGSPDVSWGRSFDFWTPSLGFAAAAHNTLRIDTAVNSFCDSQTLLPDGNMLLTGGVDSTLSGLLRWKTTDVVDTGSKLSSDRWYSTAITLPDGRVLTVGGMDINSEGVLLGTPDAAVANGIVSMTPEVYSPAVGWRSLSGATNRLAFGPEQVRASYPKAWVAPSGLVFGISADTMWQLDVNANGGLGATSVLGAFKTPYSATAPVNVGTVATAVMFAPGRILQVGGNGGVAGETLPGSNLATVVDVNGPAPVLTETAAMTQRRRMGNSLVLPNGTVVVTGGSRFANQIGTDAVFEAELWNPATGLWTTGASAKVERVYHSTTLLLPNGTVLSAGGGAPGPVSNQNAEIYYPPYLFQTVGGVAQLAARPVLSGINATSFGYGQALRVETATGQTAARLVLVRSGTVTHAFNNSQRFIELPFTQSGDLISATVPANPNLAPPGVYQLVVLNAAGVPSNAVLIGLGQNGTTPLVAPALTRGQTYAFSSVGNAGSVLGADASGQGTLLPAASASAAPAAAQFIVRNGLSNASCVSLESKAGAGRWLRHVGLRVGVGANDASAGFAAQATFCPEPAPGGQGIVLRSASHPGSVLRHRAGQIWVDLEVPTADFVANSSLVAAAVTPAANVAPTVALTAPAPNATAALGTALTLSATAADSDGSVARVDFYDGATLIGSSTAAPYSLNWTPTTAGPRSLTARATDNSGATTTSAVVTFTLTASNVAPTVAITAPLANATAVAGSAVVVIASATDSDGSIARVEFYDGATLIGTATAAPFSISWTAAATAVGPHSLTAKAFDNAGASTTSAIVTLTLTGANKAPTVSVTAPLNGTTARVGGPLAITSNPGDTDGYINKVEFYDGAALIGSVTAKPWSIQWTGTAGVHSLSVKAFDNGGASTLSKPVSITLAANAAPTVALTAPAPNTSVASGTAVQLSAVATDTDGSIARVEFYDGPTLLGTDTAAPYALAFTGGVGVHSLTAKAVDNDGASTVSAPVAFTVMGANKAPTVALTSPAPNTSVVDGTALLVTATAADSDGSIARVEFYDGAVLLGSDSAAPYSITFTGGVGVHSLTAKAFDNAGAATQSAPVALTITAAPPVIVPPAGAVACANEGGLCVVPQGATASVYYGVAGKFVLRTGVTGSIACTNVNFGDPAVGVGKACVYVITSPPAAPPALGTGLEGRYYSGTNLSGGSIARRLEAINFDWGLGGPAGVPSDLFSARWSGFIEAPVAGNYVLRTVSDDGVRVWINGVLVIDNWTIHSSTANTAAAIAMTPGERRSIRVEYQEFFGFATMQLQWQVPGSPAFVPVPLNRLYGP